MRFDDVDPARRRIMAAVRSKDTRLEMAVRKRLHALGYRYLLHARALPGKPDLCFPSRRKVVFLHGCFWHAHAGCRHATRPRTRSEFWEAKLARNRERDEDAESALAAAGWDVLVVWECAARADPGAVVGAIRWFLGPPGAASRPGA
jgi:DNA mismatch endonuclease Vsr